MPKSKDTRPRRKVTAMMPIELMDFIKEKTRERDTDLFLRLIEQEAARLRGEPQAFISGDDLRPLVESVLRDYGIEPKVLPPAKRPRKH